MGYLEGLENYWGEVEVRIRSTKESNKKAKRSKLEKPFLCAQKNKRRVVEILGSRLEKFQHCRRGPLAMTRPRIPPCTTVPVYLFFFSISIYLSISCTSRNTYIHNTINIYSTYPCNVKKKYI